MALELTGKTVEARAPTSVWAWFWIVLGLVALLAAAVLMNLHWLMVGVGLLMLGVCLWWARPAAETVIFEAHRIVPLSGKDPVEYSAIRAISLGCKTPDHDDNSPAPRPIRILCDRAQLLLPEQMSIAPVEVFRFIVSRMPLAPERPVLDSLKGYLSEQIAKFGADKVQVVHQRNPRLTFREIGKLRIFTSAMILSSLIWLIVMIVYEVWRGEQIEDSETIWLGLGIFGMLLGGVLWLISGSQPSRNKKHLSKYSQSCIVLSPAGMAMDQGDLKGKLRWEEITGIKNTAQGKIGGSHAGPLLVTVAGGQILILDIYEKSLLEIAQAISKNTRKRLQ